MSKVVRRAMRPEDYETPGEVTLFRLPAAPDEIVVVVIKEEDYVTLLSKRDALREELRVVLRAVLLEAIDDHYQATDPDGVLARAHHVLTWGK